MAVTSVEQHPVECFGPHHLRWSPLARVAVWRQRAAYRRDLRRLAKVGGHILRDIGLSPTAAAREVAKPFWQA